MNARAFDNPAVAGSALQSQFGYYHGKIHPAHHRHIPSICYSFAYAKHMQDRSLTPMPPRYLTLFRPYAIITNAVSIHIAYVQHILTLH